MSPQASTNGFSGLPISEILRSPTINLPVEGEGG